MRGLKKGNRRIPETAGGRKDGPSEKEAMKGEVQNRKGRGRAEAERLRPRRNPTTGKEDRFEKKKKKKDL